MVCARKASERPARARSQVQERDRSQELDRQKVEGLAQKTRLTISGDGACSGRADPTAFRGFGSAFAAAGSRTVPHPITTPPASRPAASMRPGLSALE